MNIDVKQIFADTLNEAEVSYLTESTATMLLENIAITDLGDVQKFTQACEFIIKKLLDDAGKIVSKLIKGTINKSEHDKVVDIIDRCSKARQCVSAAIDISKKDLIKAEDHFEDAYQLLKKQ